MNPPVPSADLPAIAHKDIQPNGRDRVDQKGQQQGVCPIVVDDEGNDPERHRQHRIIPIPIELDRESLAVINVGGFEISGLTIEHLLLSPFFLRPVPGRGVQLAGPFGISARLRGAHQFQVGQKSSPMIRPAKARIAAMVSWPVRVRSSEVRAIYPKAQNPAHAMTLMMAISFGHQYKNPLISSKS